MTAPCGRRGSGKPSRRGREGAPLARGTRGDRGGRGERGGATVLAVACLGLVLVVAVVLAEVGSWFATERRVRAAADLAALAAAAEVLTDPCGSAAVVAHANGAELEDCQVAGREVTVTTSIPAPSRWGPEVELTARARAGPA